MERLLVLRFDRGDNRLESVRGSSVVESTINQN
jgi:hypothetical protein